MWSASKPSAVILDEICESIVNDVTLKTLASALKAANCNFPKICDKPSGFQKIKSEKSYISSLGVIMKQSKIVIPSQMTLKVVDLAY